MRALFGQRRFRLAVLLAAVIGSAIGVYYVAQYVAMLILLSEIVGSHNVVEGFDSNQRGDKVEASTEASADQNEPDRTVIRLKRAHGWWSTTLLTAESYGFRWDSKWLNNDTLELNIGFGCLERVGRPVAAVGQIRISYHFAYYEKDLDLGSGPAACREIHHRDDAHR